MSLFPMTNKNIIGLNIIVFNYEQILPLLQFPALFPEVWCRSYGSLLCSVADLF